MLEKLRKEVAELSIIINQDKNKSIKLMDVKKLYIFFSFFLIKN